MLRSLCLALLAAAPAAAQTVPFANAAVTPTQLAVAGTIDAAAAGPSVDLARNSFTALSPGDRTAALASFTPAGFAVLPDLSLRTSEFQEQGIRRYLRDFRAGGTGVEGPVDQTAPSSRVFGSFASIQATTGHFDATADRTRTQFDTQGAMGGVDLRFGGKSLVGIYGGYQNLDFQLSQNIRKSNSESWFAGGYGTFGLGPFYIDLFGSYGQSEYDFFRAVRFGSNGASGYANDISFASGTNGRTWLGGGTIGLSFNFAGFELEPFAGARYTNLLIDFVDEGPNFAALRLERRTYESLLTNIGLRVGGAFQVGGATVRPEIRGAWRREWLNDNDRGFNYRFASGGTAGSTLLRFSQTSPLGGDYATVGAGFTVSGPGSPISFVLDYNGEYDSDREIHGITGGVRLTF